MKYRSSINTVTWNAKSRVGFKSVIIIYIVLCLQRIMMKISTRSFRLLGILSLPLSLIAQIYIYIYITRNLWEFVKDKEGMLFQVGYRKNKMREMQYINSYRFHNYFLHVSKMFLIF